MEAVTNGAQLLTDMKRGEQGRVLEINGGGELSRRLETLGLRPGKIIRKVSCIFCRGPVIIDLDGRMIAVGHEQAKEILLSPEGEKENAINSCDKCCKRKDACKKSRWFNFNNAHFIQLFLRLLGVVEFFCARWPVAGKVYHRLFYRRLIDKEVGLSKIFPGARVVHIGAGTCPFTALQLAKRGCKVCAVDNDSRAVREARQVVARWGMEDRVEVVQVDGMNVSFEGVDAVWISLHAYPQDAIIARAFSMLPEEGRVIYRRPRGVFSCLYPRSLAHGPGFDIIMQETKKFFSKESVIVRVGGRNAISSQDAL